MVTSSDDITIKRVTLKEISLLKIFLSTAGDSLKSFRYFNKRPLSVISNHLITALILINGIPVGYGHLDKEAGEVWLGIAIAEAEKGKGLGKLMMEYLISAAITYKSPLIRLTVDKDNSAAINLYKQSGFFIVKDISDFSLLMERVQH